MKFKKIIVLFLSILFIFFLIIVIGVRIKNDPQIKWCNSFIDEFGNNLKEINVLPLCIYKADFVKSYYGRYGSFCFPESNNARMYERNTLTPFLKYNHSIMEKDITYYNTNISKSKDKYRIITIGDSVTEGFSVLGNETYSYQLEKIFDENGFEVEVLNAGVAGYGLENYNYILKKILNNFELDHVIISINEEDLMTDMEINIVQDYFNGNKSRINQNELFSLCLAHTTSNIFWIKDRFHYKLSKNIIYRSLMNIIEKIQKFHKIEKPILEKRVNYTDEIDNMLNLLKINNKSYTIILVPIINYTGKEIETYFKNNNISFIDIIKENPDYFNYGCCSNRLVPDDNIHPNPKGHKMIADILYENLVDEIFID